MRERGGMGEGRGCERGRREGGGERMERERRMAEGRESERECVCVYIE